MRTVVHLFSRCLASCSPTTRLWLARLFVRVAIAMDRLAKALGRRKPAGWLQNLAVRCEQRAEVELPPFLSPWDLVCRPLTVLTSAADASVHEHIGAAATAREALDVVGGAGAMDGRDILMAARAADAVGRPELTSAILFEAASQPAPAPAVQLARVLNCHLISEVLRIYASIPIPSAVGPSVWDYVASNWNASVERQTRVKEAESLARGNDDIATSARLALVLMGGDSAVATSDSPWGLYTAALQKKMVGDRTSARLQLERLRQRFPHFSPAYRLLGHLAMAEGQLDLAAHYFAVALACTLSGFPRNFVIASKLGRLPPPVRADRL